jgi:DNA-binding response OmpR family regulator
MVQKKRILLMDDDLDHLLTCNLLLRGKGYEVMTMEGCKEMEELMVAVETFRPNLIFLEHDMRGICGMDLTRMLKSQAKYRSIPVIYFSSRDDIVELTNAAGADSYLKKPFDTNGLVEIARRYLARM